MFRQHTSGNRMIPTVLYKYRSLAGDSFKFTQDIFLRARLFTAPVAFLNDPCEGLCRQDVPPTATGWPQYAAAREEERTRSNLRVVSLTALNAHPLMWAHYADSHKGICIGFSTAHTPKLVTARPISYQSDLPTWNIVTGKLISVAYMTKSADWEYEQEWRIFHEEPHIQLGLNSIASVTLGARVSAADKEWVQDWIRVSGFITELYGAAFSSDKYTMDIRPL